MSGISEKFKINGVRICCENCKYWHWRLWFFCYCERKDEGKDYFCKCDKFEPKDDEDEDEDE